MTLPKSPVRDAPELPSTFGPFGGRYVPEILIPAVEAVEVAVREALADPIFRDRLAAEAREWIGRPTPLTHAARLGEAWGAEIWLKREDLAHTGAHKINNALGQAWIAKRMGAKRVLAETGAGQHGVATAAACARIGLPCRVYMGALDVARQAPNVQRMRLFGAEVVAVESGDRTLRAAIDEALRAWAGDPEGSYYLIGSAVGPAPYPALVAELQSVIGEEARGQWLECHGAPPEHVVACIGGGSNAIGLFRAFLEDETMLHGIEAGGRSDRLGDHGATLAHGRVGILHGARSLLLQDDEGQVQVTHSISAGLDYPGVGPEHAELAARGRVRYDSVRDADAVAALHSLSRTEGVLPALESAHAIAGARRIAERHPGAGILIGCSGRGDKDLGILASLEEVDA
ncbi:MAG TPA: tryptophan synthase subunit beta [Planctomycetes bacterium]|nr:tryptophan synthase subunit beta [Planctomycetota bacterium]